MSSLATELAIQKELTKAFIKTQPVDITLVPRTKEKMPAGGYRWVEEAPRLAQTMRLIEPPNPMDPIQAADGIERAVEFILLARFDAALGVYDVFDHVGSRWEVGQLFFDNGWERRAKVIRHG